MANTLGDDLNDILQDAIGSVIKEADYQEKELEKQI